MEHLYESKYVKITKNGAEIPMATVALSISSGYVILEIQAESSTKWSKPILEDDLFVVAPASMVTYRASAAGSPTFRLTFGTPLDAHKFMKSTRLLVQSDAVPAPPPVPNTSENVQTQVTHSQTLISLDPESPDVTSKPAISSALQVFSVASDIPDITNADRT
jgi:hypothetical protein